VSRRWVLSASPVITLGAAGHISLLMRLSEQTVIPAGVAESIRRGPVDCPAVQWLNKEGGDLIHSIEGLEPAVLAWDLGRSDTEVISWARRHPDFEAILDDRAARVCAAVFNIPVRGTLSIILLAKRLKLVPAVAPLLAALDQAGFRVDPSLRAQIVQHVGE
jgi:predicted nucleic acid-binding protein